MKYVFSTIIMALWAICVNAQYISLNSKEIKKLIKYVKTDSRTTELFNKLKRQADSAMLETPNPLDTVFSEGRLATDPKKIRTIISLADIQKTYSLTIVYKLSRQKKYRDKAIEYLGAWARRNKPQGNPINDTKFDLMLESYDLLKKEIRTDEKQIIEAWFRKMAELELKRKLDANNWTSHKIKVAGLIGYLLSDTSLIKQSKRLLESHLAKNLLPDGSSLDFKLRDALHYHVYTVDPLLKLAIAIKRAEGKNYYNYISNSGSSIEKSVKFLIPYLKGELKHPEFVNSTVSFDRARSANNEATFKTGAFFKPSHGIIVISSAIYFDPSLAELIKHIPGAERVYPDWPAIINKIRR
ncbi:MAG: alginate lyase family protein [Sphingobacteriaceae bacterium]|nr:alginate lyase family protein [Sphingobacteriaceae bacterium]